MNKRPKGFGSSPYYNLSPEEVSSKTLLKWREKALSGDVYYQIRTTNYYRNLWNKYSYLEGSTGIHERDYVPMDCYICGAHMPSIHDTHNADPIAPGTTAKEALDNNLPYRCCSECNRKVNEERMKKSGTSTFSVHLTDFLNTYIPFSNIRIGSKESQKYRA